MDERLIDAAETFGRLYTGMRTAHGSGTEVTDRAYRWISRTATNIGERDELERAYDRGLKAEAEEPTAVSAKTTPAADGWPGDTAPFWKRLLWGWAR